MHSGQSILECKVTLYPLPASRRIMTIIWLDPPVKMMSKEVLAVDVPAYFRTVTINLCGLPPLSDQLYHMIP